MHECVVTSLVRVWRGGLNTWSLGWLVCMEIVSLTYSWHFNVLHCNLYQVRLITFMSTSMWPKLTWQNVWFFFIWSDKSPFFTRYVSRWLYSSHNRIHIDFKGDKLSSAQYCILMIHPLFSYYFILSNLVSFYFGKLD